MVFLQDMLCSVIQKVKTSLNTFLSAMTCPNKTTWPVSGRNRRDFHNLLPVGFGGRPRPHPGTETGDLCQSPRAVV